MLASSVQPGPFGRGLLGSRCCCHRSRVLDTDDGADSHGLGSGSSDGRQHPQRERVQADGLVHIVISGSVCDSAPVRGPAARLKRRIARRKQGPEPRFEPCPPERKGGELEGISASGRTRARPAARGPRRTRRLSPPLRRGCSNPSFRRRCSCRGPPSGCSRHHRPLMAQGRPSTRR